MVLARREQLRTHTAASRARRPGRPWRLRLAPPSAGHEARRPATHTRGGLGALLEAGRGPNREHLGKRRLRLRRSSRLRRAHHNHRRVEEGGRGRHHGRRLRARRGGAARRRGGVHSVVVCQGLAPDDAEAAALRSATGTECPSGRRRGRQEKRRAQKVPGGVRGGGAREPSSGGRPGGGRGRGGAAELHGLQASIVAGLRPHGEGAAGQEQGHADEDGSGWQAEPDRILTLAPALARHHGDKGRAPPRT
mmetsp:Transcript_23434/g.61734  ORF Transcript_23434/g.61734 Transcript_23434/m.61734 type:complete len:250 (+) Transcript_23434:341-1090(+)